MTKALQEPVLRSEVDTLARDYLRVSLDRSGRARSLTEQHADNHAEATARGWVQRIGLRVAATTPEGVPAAMIAELDGDFRIPDPGMT